MHFGGFLHFLAIFDDPIRNLVWLDGFGLAHGKTMMSALTTVESSLHIVEWNFFPKKMGYKMPY